MLNKIFARGSRLDSTDPSERVLAIAELPADAVELNALLASDPSPLVRAAAARQSGNAPALGAALQREVDHDVRQAALDALVTASDPEPLLALLREGGLPDPECADIARRATSVPLRQAAVAAIRSEDALVDLALTALHAETRMAAAERVQSLPAVSRLAEGARGKDNGVARLARQRAEALRTRESHGTEADAILDQLEALAAQPGPILTAVVELNRRWQALDLADDAARLARCDAARQVIQERFDREQESQRTKAGFERRVREWSAALVQSPPATTEGLLDARTMLAALVDEGKQLADSSVDDVLAKMGERIEQWDRDHAAHAGAEALVIEAEKLAADTSIDNANLPTRWQALDRSTRTPDLTRRFEAAMMTVEQRRLAQIQATQQEANLAKQKLHALLHAAEQALAAGQVHAARLATEEIRPLKANAGQLPKPTIQRLSRAIQQLNDLEKWESFGQQTARMQLIERAEALLAATPDFGTLAQEVQKLRNEWKALDQQHAGVPKAMWERFDRACERAYAPAAKHFAELATQRKDAKKKREEFIAMAAAHAPTLAGETPDYRAIERWLRETDHAWREGDLGSVDPANWKKLDIRLKEAVAPARDALVAARERAKAERLALIEEVRALQGKASERDAPTLVKAIQARWQEHAKKMSLLQRDERALWDQFRTACDAVFEARHAKRKEEDGKKSEQRRGLDEICEKLEVAARSDQPDAELKRALREAQDQWKALTARFDPSVKEVEGRYRRARTALEGALAQRVRAREAASWQTLSAKEQLCERLDRAIAEAADANAAQSAMNEVQERWAALPELPPQQEKPMTARRDAALAALTDPGKLAKHAATIAGNAERRRTMLLELELALGLDSPPALQAQRLALQVQQLKDRFKSAITLTSDNAGERIVAWCATPGVADASDRQRVERILGRASRAPG